MADALVQDFNCTIQELKLDRNALFNDEDGVFQLHHTGIKTWHLSGIASVQQIISIAPYRN